MHTRAELVARINKLIWEGLYTFGDLDMDFEEAIEEINVELNAKFPSFTSIMTENNSTYSREVDGTVTPYFPNKYMIGFVINYVVANVFRREAEFGNEYQVAVMERDKWLSNMFRDHFGLVPTDLQDTESGTLLINEGYDEDKYEENLEDLGVINPLDQ